MSADRQKENAAEYQKSVAIFKEAFAKTVNVFIGLKVFLSWNTIPILDR